MSAALRSEVISNVWIFCHNSFAHLLIFTMAVIALPFDGTSVQIFCTISDTFLRLLRYCCALQSCAQQFQHAVSSGPVEQFLALGGLYPELAAHERSLDQYVDRLRKDQVCRRRNDTSLGVLMSLSTRVNVPSILLECSFVASFPALGSVNIIRIIASLFRNILIHSSEINLP